MVGELTKAHRARPRFPDGIVGGLLGGLGVLPLLPIASGLAIRFFSPPALPGMERQLGDVKQATYAEAAVLLVAVPLAALFYGIVLPRLLEKLAEPGRLSFEWAAAGFVISFFLAQRGVRPKHALLAGMTGALLVVLGVLAFRGSFRFRRFFARRNSAAALALALAGATFDLARRASPVSTRHLVQDRLIEIEAAALALPAVALLACFFLAKPPTALFRRLGRLAPILIALSAAAIGFPSTSTALLAAALLSFFLLSLWPGKAAVPKAALPAALLLFVAVCGWRILRVPVAPIEPFEDGQSLAFAQSYLHGARPYGDTSPLHGWGADGGLDAFVFRIFGPSLQVFQVRQAAGATMAFALLAVFSASALGLGWGSLAFLLALSLCPLPSERQMLAFAALGSLVWSARSRRTGFALVAGVLTALEILHSLEFGLFVLAGGASGLLLLPVLESGFRQPGPALRSGLRQCGAFLLGAGLGGFPFLLLLAANGGLGAFFRISFQELPRWVNAAWGLPAPPLWRLLTTTKTVEGWMRLAAGETQPWFALLALLAIAAVTILLRSVSGRFDAVDRAAWISFAVAAFSIRSILGRPDAAHVARYGVFVGLPSAWLLLRAARAPQARAALLLGASILVFVRLHPVLALDSMVSWVEGAARRDRASTGEPAPRSGGALLPADQAAGLIALKRHLDAHLRPGETFFDFNNQPALYFVMDRMLPIRYHTVAQYETAEKQREVIADLEKTRPPIAILPSGMYGGLDGISVMDRAPEVDRYLVANYEPDVTIGEWHLARRRIAR